jgi:NAD-dependent deacetylase
MTTHLEKQIESVIGHFKRDSQIVILTGAGISAESGIPTFRGKGGLWEKYDPNEVATAEAMRLRPKKVWEMHDALRQIINSCDPNPAHFAIAELENVFKNIIVITQNVDNKHQDAGSTSVTELHGNAWRVKCTVENKSWVDRTVPIKELPPRCSCGATLRPDVVFFGEQLDENIINGAYSEAARAEIMLVVGTSCVVTPAAYLPIIAKQSGAILIEINLEPSPISSLFDASLCGKAGMVMPKLVKRLREEFD